ncbi:pseudouridine synthase [Luteitalea sp. TBR-22]|uniref:RluA family pseudouridine synthase n=1 Tax=Luteitalea sp. TBR-22 TaxID=2802971 RepID=UPI001AF65F99|nr:RluA family pseudouridine synthase [Luteitalea sp. TBR-22]BCS35565.1 pseudouridine synthase [Luteitalea sp. TBR-22]
MHDEEFEDEAVEAGEGDPVTLVIGEDEAGQRADQALAALLPGLSRSQVQRLIKDGQVRIGDRVLAKSSEVLAAGTTLVVQVPDAAPSDAVAEDIPLDILFEDDHVIVVNKPAGMVVHPAAGHASGTLVNALLHHAQELSGVAGGARPGIVHRLDKGTSGVMVVAKTDQAHQELARQFHDREVEKEYVALVWGLVHNGRRIEAPIGRDPNDRQKMTTRARRSRAAVTRVTWALHLPGVSLIRVAIHTGRTHQIRVHLSSIGHPVCGDATYGGIPRRIAPHLKALSSLQRPFLHAERLVFTHPTERRRMEFEAPLAEDLTLVLEQLDAAVAKFGYKTLQNP